MILLISGFVLGIVFLLGCMKLEVLADLKKDRELQRR